MYIYHLNFYGRDRKLLQWLAYGLFFIDIVQTSLATWDGIEWFVTGWGDPARLLIVYSSGINSPVLDSLVAMLVQSYYCWRIYILSGVRWWPIALVTLTLVQAGAGIASGINATILNDFRLLLNNRVQVGSATVFLSVTAFVDIAIAATTVYLLLRQSTRRLSGSSFIITKIVTLVVETNILTSSFALIALVVFLSFPERNYFLCPLYALAKLYSNSLFVMLNQRLVLNQTPGSVRMQSSSNEGAQRINTANGIEFGMHNLNDSIRNGSQAHEAVFVRVDKTTMRDEEVPVRDTLPQSRQSYRDFQK